MKFCRSCIVLNCILALVCTTESWASVSWQSGASQGEARGLVRLTGMSHDYPDGSSLNDRTVVSGVARVMLEGEASASTHYELNSYLIAVPDSSLLSQSSGTVLDVERSAGLERSYSNSEYLHIAVDRLNWRWRGDRSEIIIGRQPINLTTTFYFTPNDFFAPFSAQAFYRVYKAGVDALRFEYRLGDLSQLSIMSVAGYQRDSSTATGWSVSPDGARRSDLLRMTSVWNNWEWGLLAGTVTGQRVLGGSLQGELFAGIGLRGEGHVREAVTGNLSEWSLGLERRWENSLTLQFEHFYHGAGAATVSGYGALIGTTAYLAQEYSALGASYQLSPLWSGQGVYLQNGIDGSAALSLGAVYSVADEAELSLGLSVPQGASPQGKVLRSEYGAYPVSLSAEYRQYF